MIQLENQVTISLRIKQQFPLIQVQFNIGIYKTLYKFIA